jgi:hypothetical protein
LPLGQGHAFSSAEAVGLEPTNESCSPPVFKTGPSSGRMASVDRRRPARLFTMSCGGRNRTCVRVINSHLPVPTQTPPHRTSLLRKRRTRRLTPAARLGDFSFKEHPAGIEPALPPWQGSTLPLHHGCVSILVELSKSQTRSRGVPTNRGCRAVPKNRTAAAVEPCQRTQSRAKHANQSTGWDSNPRFRITGAESSPLNDPC